MQQHSNLETHPCDSFAARIAGVSSGAQVPLPQMLGPPTGSMPIRLPQVRKRRERVVRGITRSTMMAGREPSWAVSLISPEHHSLLMLSFTLAFMHLSIHQVQQASTHTGVRLYSACNTHIYKSYLIIHTLFASCLFNTMLIPLWSHAWCKHSKHVQLNKI